MNENRSLSCVRFQVLTAASMKMIVFWDLAPSSLVEIYRRFRGAYSLQHQGDDGDSLDDGGSMHLWKVSKFFEGTHGARSQKTVIFIFVLYPVTIPYFQIIK
jgi:hypothetical protein